MGLLLWGLVEDFGSHIHKVQEVEGVGVPSWVGPAWGTSRTLCSRSRTLVSHLTSLAPEGGCFSRSRDIKGTPSWSRPLFYAARATLENLGPRR